MQTFSTLAALVAISLATPAVAEIVVNDAYARATTPQAVSGAAFMLIENRGDSDDRLVAAATEAAERVELHTHEEDTAGVMRMIHVEEGFPVPAGETRTLGRGGDHVMLLGLTRPLEHGDTLTLVLTFENAGEVTVEVPVDLERAAEHGHGTQGHGHNHGH